jgi:hypothetical protein
MGGPRGIAPENLADMPFQVQVDTSLKVENISVRSGTSTLRKVAQPDSSASSTNMIIAHPALSPTGY